MFPVLASNTQSAGGYTISRSVRLRSSASAYLNRTPSSTGSQTTWTWSAWIKKGTLSTGGYLFVGQAATPAKDNWTMLYYGGSDALYFGARVGGVDQFGLITTQVLRDPSAWYHIVLAVDTTQATASNRVKLYINGTQVTAFSTASYPSSSYAIPYINVASQSQFIGRFLDNSYVYTDIYSTEINFVNGQQLTPSSFGSTNATTGVWQPARYTGTYGTNGFYLNFSDNSAATAAAIGKDSSGNGNNWTPNNISVTAGATYDSMIDVPTPYADGSTNRGNYAVLNPIVPTGAAVISGGNLNIVSSATYCNGLSTIALDSGAYYAECVVTTHAAEGWGVWDLTKTAAANTGSIPSGFYGIYSGGATLCSNGSNLGTNAAATPANGDIIQVAWSNGNVWVGKNNTWYNSSFGTTGNPSTGANPTFTGLTAGQFAIIFGAGNATVSMSANFGQRAFTYTPPTNFKALNTYNLPASTVLNGGKYMAATLYTGTLLSNSITNAGSFKPDLVWVKSRSAATDHKLTDSVRGVTKALISDTTGAETTDAQGVTAFGTAGFTVGTDTNYNNLSATYVGWQWQAGQGSTSSNTNGSITSTVSVNATAGFSVVTYTGNGTAGATVGHGLGVAPPFIIIKSRSSTGNWPVIGSFLGANKYLLLNSTAASGTGAPGYDNGTLATSSVFSIGNQTDVNGSGTTYVAYCWAQIAGFSKFGSYTGNGSTDGPFVYTGHRPRWLMIKRTDAIADWVVFDTSRDAYNMEINYLVPNTSGAEAAGASVQLDGVSNGIKIRGTWQGMNASGGTYIYASFAENPFANALAR